MAGAVEYHIDARAMQQLHAELKKLGTGLQVELRRAVKDASLPIVTGIKGRAGFSGRIPRAVKAKPNFSARNPGVTVIVNPKAAPEAAPINNKGRGGTFRHPVWADKKKDRSGWTWVAQQANPFMQPTVSEIDRSVQAIGKVMDDVARKAGFR